MGLLKANLLDPHCNLLLFGGTIDDKVISILTSNLPATHRLILFSNCPGGSHTLSSMLPSLPHFSFPSIFLPTERRPTIPRPKPVIYRNAHGARIDPPINPMESIVTWLRTQKFCNYYYLQGQCPDQRCKSRHDVRLDGEQLDGLRYLARGLPCRHSNLCRDPACYAGHMCPLPTCKQECCRFYADMHVSDRRIVREE